MMLNLRVFSSLMKLKEIQLCLFLYVGGLIIERSKFSDKFKEQVLKEYRETCNV